MQEKRSTGRPRTDWFGVASFDGRKYFARLFIGETHKTNNLTKIPHIYVLHKAETKCLLPVAMKKRTTKERGRPKRFAKRMVSLTVRVPSAVKRKLKAEGSAGVAIVALVCDRWPEIAESL